MAGLSLIKDLYTTNRIVRFCTNWTAILGFAAILWQSGAWAVGFVDDRYAAASTVRELQANSAGILKEQQEQRTILDRQGRQLDFIYYDSMKREKATLDKEVFDLRAKSHRTGAEEALLQQRLDDLRDITKRLRQQEEVIRGQH